MDIAGLIYNIKNNKAFAPLIGWLRGLLNRYKVAVTASHPLRFFNLQHKVFYGKKADLKNPRTLYEKIMVLEFCCDTSLQTRLADKVAVRDYLKELGYGEYLNEVYNVFDELPPFDDFVAALPGRCVVKTSHSGGGEAVAVVEDKATADLRAVYRKMQRSLADDYGARTCSPHYSAIKPRVLVEKYLDNDVEPQYLVSDYKFFCINGEPLIINAIGHRDIKTHTMLDQYFDTYWNPLGKDTERASVRVSPPRLLAEMLGLARKLAAPLPFVRIDFYEVGGRIVFGEFTFTPGMDGFIGSYGEKILHLGDRLDISAVKRIREPQQSWL